MKKNTLILLCLVVIVLVALSLPLTPPPRETGSGEAQVGGSFTLTDTSGKPVSSDHFSGRPMLVYLGYTHCPDICPATLSMLSSMLKKMGSDADKFSTLFISLDYAHDTPAVLAEYLTAFDSRITGLTGSEAEIKSLIKKYKAYATPAEQTSPGNMLISHSGLLYIMDAQGKYVRHFEVTVTEDELLAELKKQF